MSRFVVDYYFTVTSPWSFLGHGEFSEIAREADAQVNVKAIDLGAVFAISGGLPLPKRPQQRQRYRLFELQRWRRRRDLPLNLHPKYFPADHSLGNKAILAADDLGLDAMQLAGALMRGVWCEERNVADPACIAETATALGLDGQALLKRAGSDAIEQRYRELTEEAKTRQVFGAPTYIINDEPFWGQDRLDFVREVLLEGTPSLSQA